MGKRIVRRFFSCLLVVLLVLSMTACGDTKEPEGRDNRKAGSTPSPAGEDTPTPEATPSDCPEATPTDMPEATPTDAPEVTPTEVPEVTPTEAPEITPTETPEITPTTAPEITPTAVPTDGPSTTPAPTETPVATPTVPGGRPAVAAKEGPLYVIGTVYCMAGHEADWEDYGGKISVEQMYLVEPGYFALMEKIQEDNFWALLQLNTVLEDSIKAAEEGKSLDDYYCSCKFDLVRSDTVLFSYVQRLAFRDSCEEKAYTVGSTFDTVTGEEIELRSLVKDYAQLQTIVTKDLESQWEGKFLEANWKNDVAFDFENDILRWVATETGLRIWYPAGELTDESVGEIAVDVRIVDYPQLFVEKYIGNYNGSFSVRLFDYNKNCPAEYNRVIIELVHGLGNLTYKGVLNLFERTGVECSESEVLDNEPRIYMSYSEETWNNYYVDTYYDHDGTLFLDGVMLGNCVASAAYDDYGNRTGDIRYSMNLPDGSHDILHCWGTVFFDSLDDMAQIQYGYIPDYERTDYD